MCLRMGDVVHRNTNRLQERADQPLYSQVVVHYSSSQWSCLPVVMLLCNLPLFCWLHLRTCFSNEQDMAKMMRNHFWDYVMKTVTSIWPKPSHTNAHLVEPTAMLWAIPWAGSYSKGAEMASSQQPRRNQSPVSNRPQNLKPTGNQWPSLEEGPAPTKPRDNFSPWRELDCTLEKHQEPRHPA